MGGATKKKNIVPRSLKTTRSNFKIKKIIYDPLIFANNRFSKIWSINSDRDGKRQSWAKMSKFIPLSLRLSGIEFSLVWD